MGTDKRTDTTKLVVDFLNFAKASKRFARAQTHTHKRTHTARAIGIYSISMFTVVTRIKVRRHYKFEGSTCI